MSALLFDLFLKLAQRSADSHPLYGLLDLSSEAELSIACDLAQIQDSFRFRIQRRSLLLARFLIDDRGELKVKELKSVIDFLERQGQIFYPDGDQDRALSFHHLLILKKFRDDPSYWKLLKRSQRPLCHKGAAHLIAETMGLSLDSPLTEAHIRQALLAACLAFLRQTVGSCFATAPAILIQSEEPLSLLSDLQELLATGKLKRTFGGVEHIVPLSPSSGVGDLKKRLFTKDSKEKPWFSPGLLNALQVAGIFKKEESLEKKRETLYHLTLSCLEKDQEISCEGFLRELLRSHLGLTLSDLEEHQRSQQTIQRGNLFFHVPKHSLRKKELCEEFYSKLEEAKSAFKQIADNALLKAWEFTLASFSEIKMEFSRWNLYASLGFDPHEKGGIGEIIYSHVQQKISETNHKMEEMHREYELASDQLRAVESLLRNASSQSELFRLKAEHQTRYYHMQSCLDLRNDMYRAASHYPTFFSELLKKYEAKFPEFFQEIYDAEMQDFTGESYDDSPAGFRLVYKHGRGDASLWTLIHDQTEWMNALVEFFAYVESDISSAFDSEQAKEDIGMLTTAIISHLRSEAFLESALYRILKAHKASIPNNLLQNLEKIEKKPWAYTSGGTMEILVRTYFRRQQPLAVEERSVESTLDLLIFILDTLKALPPRIINPFLEQPHLGMLMSSPTHAFILRPGFTLFQEGWQDAGFTYTWVRDHFLKPREDFFSEMLLSEEEQEFLLTAYSHTLSPLHAHRLQTAFSFVHKRTPLTLFRQRVSDAFHGSARLMELFDGFIYSMLPLTPKRALNKTLKALCPEIRREEIFEEVSQFNAFFYGAKEVTALAKAAWLLSERSICLDRDLHLDIAKRAAQLGILPPPPLMFADTNWSGFYFAFLVNPSTLELELWRVDRTGSQGFPMSSWKQWMEGKNSQPWSIYTQPYEYH